MSEVRSNNFWPEERVLRLKILVSNGYNYRQISDELGISRNAVCGKVMRMRLAMTRPTAEPHEAKPRPDTRPSKPKPVYNGHKFRPPRQPEPITLIRDEDIPAEQLKTLLELENFHCRWPIGNPHESEFRFCGAQKVVGPHPYCLRHMRRARPAWQG